MMPAESVALKSGEVYQPTGKRYIMQRYDRTSTKPQSQDSDIAATPGRTPYNK